MDIWGSQIRRNYISWKAFSMLHEGRLLPYMLCDINKLKREIKNLSLVFYIYKKCPLEALGEVVYCKAILPFPNISAPARLRLSVPHVSTKPLKSSLSLQAKILFCLAWKRKASYRRETPHL